MEVAFVPDVIGRERELGDMARFLASLEVAPGALIFEGEAGIGKTTLWQSAVAEARRRGWHVLACRASESESALSFVALADLFEDVGEAALERLAEPQRRALDAATLRVAAAPDRVALSRGALNVVRALASEAPVVLAVDDLQWLDTPSADALGFIVRRLGDARVGVVASLRRPARLALEFDRAFAPGRLTVLEVAPLALRELERVVRSHRDIRLTRPEWSELHRVSGGNPLFALQLAEAVAARGRLAPGEALPVPATLAEAVEERLRALSEAARSSLLTVAILAQPSRSLVEATELADAVDAGIVAVDGERVRSRILCTRRSCTRPPTRESGARPIGVWRSSSPTPRKLQYTSHEERPTPTRTSRRSWKPQPGALRDAAIWKSQRS